MTNMLQIKRVIFASVVLALCAVTPVHAQDVVGGIDMQTFSTDIVVASDAHVTVTEVISGEFQTAHHGIYRSIPYEYTVNGHAYRLPVTINSVKKGGAPIAYSQSKSNGSVVLKIGDADKLVTGRFRYTITYEVDRAILAQDDGAFFAWDAPGDAWEDPFADVIVNVTTDVPNAIIDAHCYYGAYGSTDACGASNTDSTATFTWPGPLTATVFFDASAIVVPEETVVQTLLYDYAKYFWFVFPLVALIAMGTAWWRKGRDPAGRGVIVPEYEPPKGMGPAEVGALHDGKAHKHDIVAMIVDLAVRGYIVIEERGKHYALVRTEKSIDDLQEYEAKFVQTAFGNDKEVELTGRVVSFGRAWMAATSALHVQLESDGLFSKNPETIRGAFIALGVLLIMVTWFVVPGISTSVIPMVAGGLTAAIVMLFGLVMPRRTVHGVEVWEHVQGYKLYLSTAEKYRLAWQEKEGIFEKYLPYALALGVADAWSKELGPTLKEPPRWYRGNWSTWNTWYFMHNMHAFSSAMSRSYATSTQSSRSGGGGFSGGGFGGGGGGGW